MVVERLFGGHAAVLHHRRLQLLFGANAIAVLGVAMVSPILESLTGPFDVTASTTGLLVTAIAFPAIFLIPVGGVLTDRIGRKPLLIVGLLLFGAGGAGVALTTHFGVALGLRFLQGIGMSATFPAIVSSIRDLYSDAEEATAQGLRVGVSGSSQAVFSAAAGFLVVTAWQYPFLLYASAIPVAICIFIWFDEPLSRRGSDVNDIGRGRSYIDRVSAIIAHPRVAMILLAHTVSFFTLFTFLTYNSFVVVEVAGGGAREAGIIVAIFSLTYAGVATQAGRITDRFATRTKPLLLAHLHLAVGLAIFALAPHVVIAGIGAIILALGMGIVAPMYRSLISGFGPMDIRGGLVSVGESLGWVAVTVVPIVIGGAIGLLELRLGRAVALQTSLVGVAGITGMLGLMAVLYADRLPSTSHEQTLM